MHNLKVQCGPHAKPHLVQTGGPYLQEKSPFSLFPNRNRVYKISHMYQRTHGLKKKMNPLTELVKNVTNLAVEMQMVDTVTTLECFPLTPKL